MTKPTRFLEIEVKVRPMHRPKVYINYKAKGLSQITSRPNAQVRISHLTALTNVRGPRPKGGPEGAGAGRPNLKGA